LRAQVAYVANADSGDISAYSIDSNRNLIVQGSPFPAGIEPFSVSLSEDVEWIVIEPAPPG